MYLATKGTVFSSESVLKHLILLRLLLFEKFSQAFLTTEIIIFSLRPPPDGRSLGDIGLAVGVLNKFLWLRCPTPFFPPHSHVLDKVVKNHIKEQKKKDE